MSSARSTTTYITAAVMKRMIIAGSQMLEVNKGQVDSLNVFPVPDGDTGTNMSLTLLSAVREVNNVTSTSMADLAEALSKGALRGARGNSGVILSQILKGFANVMATCEEIDTKIFAKGLKTGTELAYSAVSKPKEGTILTVVRGMAEEAVDVSKRVRDIDKFLEKVLAKMDENTAAIIDAMSNIKPGEGGTVDLSSIEKMLSELLQLTSKNNSLLESIDGKMDIIKLTIEAAKDEIIAHLGNGGGNVDVDAILNKLDEFMSLSNANSEAILKKMDTIINLINNIKTYDDSALMAKLDDILAAIKDHNITVDITGKVECNCNCGGNHEGILGDLDDILG